VCDEQPMPKMDTSRYALDPPPPGMQGDSEAWRRAVQNAQAQLSLRCPVCDWTASLAESCIQDVSQQEDAVKDFNARCRDLGAVREALLSFEVGLLGAEGLLDKLASAGPRELQDFQEERRLCSEGGSYTLAQLKAHYGEIRGKQEWDRGETYSLAKRLAYNGEAYTLAEFQAWYGASPGLRLWRDAPVAWLSKVLRLISDVERRSALHLAQLRRFPKIRTPCCGVEYCFKCQVSTWHPERTCEQVLQHAIEVQFCPTCGVPTQRTEGCSHMVCPCGTHWTWDAASDSGSDDIYGDYGDIWGGET